MIGFIDSPRRWFGALFILLALGMTVWGFTVLGNRLHGVAYLVYWLVCMGFTVVALVIALVDLGKTRKRLRDEQRVLVENAIRDLSEGSDQPPRGKSERGKND